MFHEYQTIPQENDECLTRGICPVNPTLSFLQEVLLLYIKELSFYLLKLKDFGVTNDTIKNTITYVIFNIITNAEYNQEQFQETISKLDEEIEQSKALYENFCEKNQEGAQFVKTYFKRGKKFSMTDAIKKGEKYFLKKTGNFTPIQKDLFDIMLFLVKSIGLKIVEAQRLGSEYDDAYYATLTILNAMNLNINEFSEEKAKEEIKKTIEIYYDIVGQVFNSQKEIYGELSQTEVSFSTEIGKSVLVSGSDFKKLEMVLKATENTQINVYTHGLEMLMAHAFPKLRSHPNLKGHFGAGLDTSLIDFASFPGAILMTKASTQKVEYLYRGRLYTLDHIAPPGVVKIKDMNFEPLIKSALDSKGFVFAQQKPPIKVGFSEKDVMKKIDEIFDKLTNNEIKHLYIVGLLNYPTFNKQYFDTLFELIPKDCYSIALCCHHGAENIYHLDAFYDYSLIYQILKELKERVKLNEANISVFLTKCDKHTISNLLYLKNIGIKNVYTCKCPPNLINPTLINTLKEHFGIMEITDPVADIRQTLNGN